MTQSRQYQREWRRQNPELVRAQTQRVMARRRADPERHAKHKKYQRDWRAKNPHKAAAHSRKSRLRITYGLTPAEYQAMVDKQAGKCAICRLSNVLHIDHSHDTDRVRGLLCFRCNTGLGHFDEDVDRMLEAIEYLRRN